MRLVTFGAGLQRVGVLDGEEIAVLDVPTVNYGTSTGLMDVELGENLEIDDLVRTAEVYARVAMRVCGVV